MSFTKKTGCLLLWVACAMSATALAQMNEEEWQVSILLPDLVRVDAEKLAASLTRRLSEHEKFLGVQPRDDTLAVRVGKGTAQISIAASPASGEWSEACRRAVWYWRGACEVVGAHKAIANVSLRGTQLRRVESAVIMTKIVAGVIENSNALAVQWQNALQSREAFLKGSEEVSVRNIPAMLWVDYAVKREASGHVSAHTRGLKAFDLMEIEAKDAPFGAYDVLELMISTTQYLITRGPVLQDGDSIGASSARRIFVKHADSYANPGKRVYRIHFGS